MASKRLLNRMIVAGNLSEAENELAKLCNLVDKGELSAAQLQVGLLHTYHQINFAWNARFASDDDYRHLTQERFRRCGRYPRTIENL